MSVASDPPDPLSSASGTPEFPASKRVFDLALALPLLVATMPLMLVVAIAIRITSGPPVLFWQTRPGLAARLFRMAKFRTMQGSPDPRRVDRGDAGRITGLGSFLRATSLDELPTLWNVVRGDMSLVGPRPLLPEYLPLYSPEQSRRHDVPPGVTGWAQINGRNSISWEEKFELDVWYVDHRSVWLDLRILALTAAKVFRREGVNQQGSVTVDSFTGSSRPQTRGLRQSVEGRNDDGL